MVYLVKRSILLGRMYIVMLQDEIFCRHQLGPFDLWCHLGLGFLCWFFCLDDLYIGDRGVLKSPTITELRSICAFKYFSVCLMKLSALTLGAYRLIIVISFWCTAAFISMKWPSLSHSPNVRLKSTLSDTSIAIPACEAIGFHPNPVFIAVKTWVSCKNRLSDLPF
jgi:hypothetical protein